MYIVWRLEIEYFEDTVWSLLEGKGEWDTIVGAKIGGGCSHSRILQRGGLSLEKDFPIRQKLNAVEIMILHLNDVFCSLQSLRYVQLVFESQSFLYS